MLNKIEADSPIGNITVTSRNEKDDLIQVAAKDLSDNIKAALSLILEGDIEGAAVLIETEHLTDSGKATMNNFIEVLVSEKNLSWHQIFEHPALMAALNLKPHSSNTR